MTNVEIRLLCIAKELYPNAYGLTIWRALVAKETKARSLSLGAVYVAIDSLVEKGMIWTERADATVERGGREKLYVCLTEEGERVVRKGEEK